MIKIKTNVLLTQHESIFLEDWKKNSRISINMTKILKYDLTEV